MKGFYVSANGAIQGHHGPLVQLVRTFIEVNNLTKYSRRNCLRISGIPETKSESTDDIVLDMANAIGADLILEDIERSHWLGKPKPRSVPQHAGQLSTRPRSIIVKFST